MRGLYLAVDGSEGSGKSLFVRAARTWCETNHLPVFDLRAYEQTEHWVPTLEEVPPETRALLVHEPSVTWIGAAIREEMVHDSDRSYTGMEVAQTFALNRLILLRRVILPALERGYLVFSDRCVAASIVYQPIMDATAPLEQVLSLSGNALELSTPIDHLFIMLASAEVSLQRLAGRIEKNDRAVFDRAAVIAEHQSRFTSSWLRDLFEKHGTRVTLLNTDPLDIPAVLSYFQKQFDSLLSSYANEITAVRR